MHRDRHRNPERRLLQYISNEAKDEKAILVHILITTCHLESCRLGLAEEVVSYLKWAAWVVLWEDGEAGLVGV